MSQIQLGRNSMHKQWYGYAAVIAAALLWGVGGAVAKFLFNQAVSPFLLVKIRLLLSFTCLVILLLLYKPRLLHVPRRELPYFAVLGIGGMAMIQFFYFLTISLTNVATAVFLQYLAPVLIAVYTVVWEKCVLSRCQTLAVAAATLGGLFIMLDQGGSQAITVAGIISGLASALAAAFNTVYSRRAVREFQPITVLTYTCGFGALFWWCAVPGLWEPGSLTLQHWLMFAYVVLFSTIIPFFLFFLGLRYLAATNVSVTSSLEPVIAAVAAYLALGEQMGGLQMLGAGLVVAAIVLLQWGGDEVKAVAASKSLSAGCGAGRKRL